MPFYWRENGVIYLVNILNGTANGKVEYINGSEAGWSSFPRPDPFRLYETSFIRIHSLSNTHENGLSIGNFQFATVADAPHMVFVSHGIIFTSSAYAGMNLNGTQIGVFFQIYATHNALPMRIHSMNSAFSALSSSSNEINDGIMYIQRLFFMQFSQRYFAIFMCGMIGDCLLFSSGLMNNSSSDESEWMRCWELTSCLLFTTRTCVLRGFVKNFPFLFWLMLWNVNAGSGLSM